MDETLFFPVPGSDAVVQYTYGPDKALTRLSCAGQTYLTIEGGRSTFGDTFVTSMEVSAGRRLLRQVRSGIHFWVEEYSWDERGRLELVDGTRIERDSNGRVTACLTPEGAWRYGYRGHHLSTITRESYFERRIARGPDGRAIQVRDHARLFSLSYTPDGVRTDLPPLPLSYQRDSWGRLWTISAPDGSILRTYLWDRYRCLARIDGPPGAPLAAVFSLDPTGTPVRVITPASVTRIPRDAYGENLLAHPGTPGLYGATIYQGHHYLAERALDPLCGSYTAPDPLDGTAHDPRRSGSYSGPLLVEHPAAGPYAVCQHDPISRADPTGAFSWWILLTDITWALQNNMLGLFGLDFMFNFWGSIFTGNFDKFTDREFIYSERAGTWGWRSDGLIGKITNGRAFAFQHQIWVPSEEFHKLEHARAFLPAAPFRPGCYGTLLRGVPASGDPFLLAGSAGLSGQRLINWTRAGGRAEPVAPAMPVPIFPSGGLHFEAPITSLRAPLACTLSEVEPLGSLHSGSAGDRTLIDIPAVGMNLAGLVLLTDTTPNAYIEPIAASVEQAGRTRVAFARAINGLGPNSVRLRSLNPPAPAENLTHNPATPPAYLETTGSTQPYAPGNPLRLSQAGSPVGAALIDRLEVRLTLDAPFSNLNGPFTVHRATPLGPASPASLLADADRFESATPPNRGDVLLLANAAGTNLAVVVIERNANQCRVDRPLQPALGATGAAITWQRLAVTLTPLGRKADALEADAALVYRAEAPRTAPAGDVVLLRAADGRQAARRVSARVYDALVLATPLPGTQAAPYSVERFTTAATNAENLNASIGQALVFNPPLPADAVALHMQQFAAATLSTGAPISAVGAGPVQFNLAGTTATLNVPAAGLLGHGVLQPSSVIGLSSGGPTTPALVRRVRLSLTLDRQLPLAANGLEALPLDRVGWPYDAVPLALPAGSLARAGVTVRPRTSQPAANTRVQMPHFQPGELVEVNYGAAGRRLFRIATPASDPLRPLDGTTLGLSDDFAPAALPASVTVQRVEAVAPSPATGGSRSAINGNAIGAAGVPTSQVSFDLWSGDGLRPGQLIAIVSGTTLYPAIVSTIDRIELELAPLSPLAGGAYTIAGATPTRSVVAPDFSRDGSAVIIPSGDLVADAARLVLAVPFRNGTNQVAGNLSGGTVRIPDDDDDGELTRLASLKAHELTHTRQWSAFGPLMLFLFPTFILEGVVEASTEIELPAFSAYVPATIVNEGGQRLVQIASAGGITFAAGDTVQFSWAASQPGPNGPVNAPGAGVPRSIVLGPEEPAASNRFHFNAGIDQVPGTVVNLQVRRQSNATPGWDGLLSFLQVISSGGLMNFVGGAVYGGLFSLIGRGAYALYRLIAGQGKTYPATVEGADAEADLLIRLSDDGGRNALAGAARIIIEQGDTSLVRDVASNTGDVLRLSQAVSLSGSVRIAPYATLRPDSTFDWHRYYPASLPDPGRPATVQIEAVDGESLALRPFDRVQIVRGTATVGRTITAVNGNQADLDETLPGDEPIFRIARLGASDPIGNFDSVLLTNEYGMDWMRWIFDPYSQLQYRLQPDPQSFEGILARVGRYAFGASSWSFIWASVLTIDRVHQAEHLARIEQSASSESGDTYSPLGRLRGELSVVGDIARYWWVPLGGLRDSDMLISPGDPSAFTSWTAGTPGLQDAPGVHLPDTTRVMTAQRIATPAEDNGRLNSDLRPVAGIADPANDLPDMLFAKRAADPTINAVSGPDGFIPGGRGWLPSSAELQRSTGMYVAFSRPGLHRLTVRNDVVGAAFGREAQARGRQQLWFDRTIAPVVVSLGGQIVAEGDTLTLVRTQRVQAIVTPSGGRRSYALNLLRPEAGEILRRPDPADPLLIEAGRSNGSEEVELSRLYCFDPTTGSYDHPVLARHGIHLPTDLHIPIRLFTISVVDNLPVRRTLSLEPTEIITELRPGGEGFVIIPTAIGPQGARVISATSGGSAVAPATLTALGALIQPAPAALPPAISTFAGPGGVISLRFTPALAIAAETSVQIQIQVGPTAPFTEINVGLTLRP